MKKQTRLVLIVVAVVLLLGAASAVLLLNPAKPQQKSTTFTDYPPTDVKKVAIRNNYGTMDVAFTGEGYQADDIPAPLVAIQNFMDMLGYCGNLVSISTVGAPSKDMRLYGLDKPLAQVEISYANGKSATLTVGSQEVVTGNYYCTVSGSDKIYLFGKVRVECFLQPKSGYVDHMVTPKLAVSSPMTALWDVTFTGGPLAQPVVIRAVASKDPQVILDALSFGAATHIVRGNGVYELDQTYGVDVMGGLLGIKADDIVGYNLTDEQIAAFGFDRPAMQAEFDLKNGTDAPLVHYKLTVLNKDGKCYMTCNDNKVIYQVPAPSFLNIEYSKLCVRWFLSPMLMDISGISIRTQGQTYDFAVTGDTNDTKRVTLNGKELDIERFRTLYKLLTSAAHDGTLLDNLSVQGEPELTLTYTYQNKDKKPDVLKLYKGDVRRLYVNINGVTEVAMREMFLTRVQQALSDIRTDKEIVTDW